MAVDVEIGKKYGHWTVLNRVEKPDGRRRKCLCKCDCGKIKYVNVYHLTQGASTNCGCVVAKNKSEWNKANKRTHGGTAGEGDRLYTVYRGIVKRCYLKSHPAYRNYGGRGIAICDEWRGSHGFEKFRTWAYANGYDPDAPKGKCTIDRIDVNGNYEPSNCRWVDAKTQGNNRRDNHLVTYNGETHTVTEWAAKIGMKPVTLFHRLMKGWPVEKALTQPLRVW